MIDFEQHRTEIEDLCKRLRIRRLDIFGSATRDDFNPNSDVDVLVQFERDRSDKFNRYFELKENLEDILGRSVDLVIEDAIKNPYFRMCIEKSRKNLYATRSEEISL